MTITKKAINKEFSKDEFLKYKKFYPFEEWRQDSKALNFGMIFNMSYKRFSSATLETSWSLEKIEAFIEDKDLQDSLTKMRERHQDVEDKLCKYYTVASYLKNGFFKAYPGLLTRIDRNKEFALENGYIRSFHGAIRHLPLLFLSHNEKGERRKDEDFKEVAEWVNITSNTSIQTDEICTVMQNMNEWSGQEQLWQNAPMLGTVHDSVDFEVVKKEAVKIISLMQEYFEKEDKSWQRGLKFPIDITIVDLTKGDQYYKHGRSVKDFLKENPSVQK